MLSSVRDGLFCKIRGITWLSKYTQSTEMKFQDILVDPDQNLFHVVVLLEHGTILHEQGKILRKLLVGIK